MPDSGVSSFDEVMPYMFQEDDSLIHSQCHRISMLGSRQPLFCINEPKSTESCQKTGYQPQFIFG